MRKLIKYPPLICNVNWFRKDAQGNFLWPGFGENMRVLKWIVDRCHGRANAFETAVGWAPTVNDIDLGGLDGVSAEQFEQAQTIDKNEWIRELLLQDELFIKLYERLPKEMIYQRELLISRL